MAGNIKELRELIKDLSDDTKIVSYCGADGEYKECEVEIKDSKLVVYEERF